MADDIHYTDALLRQLLHNWVVLVVTVTRQSLTRLATYLPQTNSLHKLPNEIYYTSVPTHFTTQILYY